MFKHLSIKLAIFIGMAALMPVFSGQAQEVRDIIFPIASGFKYTLTDSYGDARSGGRIHLGVDIMVEKMTPLVAVVDGEISFLTETERDWGMAIYIEDELGYSYRYLHVNNDTPGTDNNKAILAYAFAKGIDRGVKVKAGQVIAFAGDSGNAEAVGSHLHFEIWTPGNGSRYDSLSDRQSIDPYPGLIKSLGQNIAVPENPKPDPVPVQTLPENNYTFTSNLTIGDRGADVKKLQQYLNTNGFVVAVSGPGSIGSETEYFGPATQNALAKFQADKNISPAIGYFGPITRNHINSNYNVATVNTLTTGWLIKEKNSAPVFYVNEGLELMWIVSETVAVRHFGQNWSQQIKEFTDLTIFNPTYGENLN